MEKKPFGVIYKAVCRTTGKIYIGQTTVGVKERWKCHLRKEKGGASALRAALDKYGGESFDVREIIRCDSYDELNNREIFCIRIFKSLSPNGYNLTTGGKNAPISIEQRIKIGNAHRTVGSVAKGRQKSTHGYQFIRQEK